MTISKCYVSFIKMLLILGIQEVHGVLILKASFYRPSIINMNTFHSS